MTYVVWSAVFFIIVCRVAYWGACRVGVKEKKETT
jgi:hypothetical protein